MDRQILRRIVTPIPSSKLDCHPLLARIYASRQIQSANELERSLEHLLPYHALLNIDKAASVLSQAIMQSKKIVVVGDFDADGATSTAVAIRALKNFGAKEVAYVVPNRFTNGYGLTPELITNIKQIGADLILTVDNGIANHAGVEAAKAAGIKVVITDHHLPGETLPIADVIVNPNQHHDPFPSKNLAGVGVVFYVMLALRRCLKEQGWFGAASLPQMANLLDLVALGTVADLVPLDHNNRILVHQGLRRIRGGLCVPGIVALLELSNRDFRQAEASDLGFCVAARLNAAGRLDDMSLGIECLLTDDSHLARQHARLLDQLNKERRHIEFEMQAQAEKALDQLQNHLKGELPIGLCIFDESWHQGVIGILASRIKEKYHRPVIAFAPGLDGELKGSARSIANLHIRDALAAIDAAYPNLMKKFGGHAMAAGLTITKHFLQDFRKIFNEVLAKKLHQDDLKHYIWSDGALMASELCLEVAYALRDGGPWGQAFPEPLFDDTFRILEQRLVADKHLKLRLTKDDLVLDAMAFFVDTSVWPDHRCQAIHAAYHLTVNEYKGRSSVQLVIEHVAKLNDC